MKYLLALFTFVLTLASLPEDLTELQIASANELTSSQPLYSNASTDFMKGLLESVNEPNDVQKLYPCLPDLKDLFAKIGMFLGLMKSMRISEMSKGLDLVLPAFNALFKGLRECLKKCPKKFFRLSELIIAMYRFDSKAISVYILLHPAFYITAINDALKCFQAQDHHCLGKTVGSILKGIFLP
eukprot:TRINITY_DN9791_c0_g1_i5.p1 TRINITY_DN9791_c0_g1~~TRINITY_DN9791_c0_g1_i5.p1  ORF type:complete len:184 (-),score=31.85 TRINITY_DN9791_c0_g1_i5:127-678(-)